MADLVGFNPDDLNRLYSLLQRVRDQELNYRSRPAFDVDTTHNDPSSAPEVYIAKTSSDGIGYAYIGAIDTGTGTEQVIYPGYGECDFMTFSDNYLVDPDFRQIGLRNQVYNISENPIPGNTWLLVIRVKSGQYIAVIALSPEEDTGTSSGTFQIVTGCGLIQDEHGVLRVDFSNVAGTGLEWGVCSLVVKFDCHISANEAGELIVDVDSLAGDHQETALKKYDASECSPLSFDYNVVETRQQIPLLDSRLLRIGNNLTQVNIYALNEYRYNAAGVLVDWEEVSQSLVIKNIDICDCDTGTGSVDCTGTGTNCAYWYCLYYEVQGFQETIVYGPLCQQLTDEQAQELENDGAYFLSPGLDTREECEQYCADTGTGTPTARWYCITPIFTGQRICDFLTPQELTDAIDAGGILHSGPHDTEVECEEECDTGTGGVVIPCCEGTLPLSWTAEFDQVEPCLGTITQSFQVTWDAGNNRYEGTLAIDCEDCAFMRVRMQCTGEDFTVGIEFLKTDMSPCTGVPGTIDTPVVTCSLIQIDIFGMTPSECCDNEELTLILTPNV